jgi:hypothetical protein
VKAEDKAAGKVGIEVFKKYFSYTTFGSFSPFLIFAIHFVINLNSIAVGLFLAFTLSKKFS